MRQLWSSSLSLLSVERISDASLCLQAELKEKLTKMYDVRDSNGVFVFGFRTQVCGACSHIILFDDTSDIDCCIIKVLGSCWKSRYQRHFG